VYPKTCKKISFLRRNSDSLRDCFHYVARQQFPRKAAEHRRTPKRFARKKSSPAFLLS
jgi:hypothetical protein